MEAKAKAVAAASASAQAMEAKKKMQEMSDRVKGLEVGNLYGGRVPSNTSAASAPARSRLVYSDSKDGERTSLRMTLPLPRCPPHLSEAQRGRLWVALAWAGPRRPGRRHRREAPPALHRRIDVHGAGQVQDLVP